MRRAGFLAGAGRGLRELGPPWRPALRSAFPGPRQGVAPQLVVEVTASYDAKPAAVVAHASQFEVIWERAAGAPPTHLSSRYFLAAVEGRDRGAAKLIGCEFGKGLLAKLGLNGDEVAWLLDAGR